jgi:hypothetical protein
VFEATLDLLPEKRVYKLRVHSKIKKRIDKVESALPLVLSFDLILFKIESSKPFRTAATKSNSFTICPW